MSLRFCRSLLVGPLAVVCLGCAPPPALRVTPDSGSRTGGLPVRISGAQTGEDGEPAVLTGHGPLTLYFGNRAAVGVVIEGDYLIRATTPKRGAAGPVDVSLRFEDGVAFTINDGFEYQEHSGLVLTPSIVQ